MSVMLQALFVLRDVYKRQKFGSDCVIGSGSMLDRAVIHDGVDVLSSVILESEVDEGTHVGPFAYIRPNCHVGKEVKVGDFVELKNSNIRCV